MRKYLIFLIVLAMLLTFTGCRSRAEPRILLDDEYLQITQTGGKIDVYDVESNMTYTFYIRHKKPSNRVLEAYTAVESDNIKIVVKPKKIILYDKAEKKVYTLRLFFGHLTLKPFSTGISGRKGAIE